MTILVKCDKGDTHHFRSAKYFKVECNALLVFDEQDRTIAAFAQGKWNNVIAAGEEA